MVLRQCHLPVGFGLLLFVVGLEFSITKLMRTKEAAAVLAVTNLAVNMFAGFVIGAWLGWPLIDTIFMAGALWTFGSADPPEVFAQMQKHREADTQLLLRG